MAQKSIAKNTLFLTFRMLLLMGITFFTSRVVLDKLGVESFGIYNVVSSLAVSFSFFVSSLTNATQRFITIEIGKGEMVTAKHIFNQHFEIYLIISILCLVVAECLGIWLILNKLNIPAGRITDSIWVYQFALATIIVNLLSIPSTSCVIAHEDMNVYSYVGVAEGAIKLLIAYLLIIAPFNKLIFYSFLMFFATFACNLTYVIYARLKYAECRFQKVWDKVLLKKSFSFISWNLLGTARAAIITQGTDFILNIFLGPVANAARAVTNQVSGAIFRFSSNILVAAQPQLVKSYAQGDMERLSRLFFKTSRFSYFVLWILICPFLFCLNNVLHIWLKEVPQWTDGFLYWQLICSLVYILTRPLWAIILAVGKLQRYVIWDTITSLLPVFAAYIILYLNFEPVNVYMSFVLFQIVNNVVLLLVVRRYIGYSLLEYCQEVVWKILMVSVITYSLSMLTHIFFTDSFLQLIFFYVISFLLTALVVITIGISKEEKAMVFLKIQKMIHK